MIRHHTFEQFKWIHVHTYLSSDWFWYVYDLHIWMLCVRTTYVYIYSSQTGRVVVLVQLKILKKKRKRSRKQKRKKNYNSCIENQRRDKRSEIVNMKNIRTENFIWFSCFLHLLFLSIVWKYFAEFGKNTSNFLFRAVWLMIVTLYT